MGSFLSSRTLSSGFSPSTAFMCAWCLRRPEEGIWSPWRNWLQKVVVPGTKLLQEQQATSAFNCWATSPAPKLTFFLLCLNKGRSCYLALADTELAVTPFFGLLMWAITLSSKTCQVNGNCVTITAICSYIEQRMVDRIFILLYFVLVLCIVLNFLFLTDGIYNYEMQYYAFPLCVCLMWVSVLLTCVSLHHVCPVSEQARRGPWVPWTWS